jgi:predicted AAA+ superfamily ATPase
MPWTPDEAERHTHKATTPELQQRWAKVANERLENTGTKPGLSGKPTPWSRDRRNAVSPRPSSRGGGRRCRDHTHRVQPPLPGRAMPP